MKIILDQEDLMEANFDEDLIEDIENCFGFADIIYDI